MRKDNELSKRQNSIFASAPYFGTLKISLRPLFTFGQAVTEKVERVKHTKAFYVSIEPLFLMLYTRILTKMFQLREAAKKEFFSSSLVAKGFF